MNTSKNVLILPIQILCKMTDEFIHSLVFLYVVNFFKPDDSFHLWNFPTLNNVTIVKDEGVEVWVMFVIEWGTAMYQLLIFLVIIGIPIVLVFRFLKQRKNRLEKLEQRIEKLEREQAQRSFMD